jgi:hypothetical protein
MQIPFLGPSYQSRSKNIDCQRTINYFPELNSEDSKSVIALIGTPGFKYFTTAGKKIRCMHPFNGLMYVVAGENLYSIDGSGTVSNSLGTISTDSGIVSMQDNGLSSQGVGGNQICIADNVGGYIYNVKTGAFTNITGSLITSEILRPIGDNLVQLTPSSGTQNYLMINEETEDTSNYVSSASGKYVDFYNSPAREASGVINSVTLTGVMKSAAGAGGMGGFALNIGGVNYYSKGNLLTNAFLPYSYTWLTDPSLDVPQGNILVSNTAIAWTAGGSTLTISGNDLTVTNSGAAIGSASQPFSTIVGSSYMLSFYFQSGSAAGGRVKIGNSVGDNSLYDSGLITDTQYTKYTTNFKATATTTYLTVYSEQATINLTALYNSFELFLVTTSPWTWGAIDSLTEGMFLDAKEVNECCQFYKTLNYKTDVSGISSTGIAQITYIDGYFVGIGTNTMNAACSNLYDGSTWSALATSPVSGAPDKLQAVVNSHQQVWFIKEYTSEVWYDAGVATANGFPFQRIPGAIVDYGTVSPFSVVMADNTIFWVASQRSGNAGEFIGIVALNGFTPIVISPTPINYQISKMGDLSEVTSYSYSEGGHTFVVFNFPSITYVYDTTTKMWHERSYFSGEGRYVLNRHIGECYCFFNNKHYISDYRNNGNIYELSADYLDDDGVPIISTRVAQHLADKQNLDTVFFSKLQVDIETGQGLDEVEGVITGTSQSITPVVNITGVTLNSASNADGTYVLSLTVQEV